MSAKGVDAIYEYLVDVVDEVGEKFSISDEEAQLVCLFALARQVQRNPEINGLLTLTIDGQARAYGSLLDAVMGETSGTDPVIDELVQSISEASRGKQA